jgi:uncharacterized protein
MTMEIDLSNASEGRSYDFAYDIEDISDLLGERLVSFLHPVKVSGSYVKFDAGVMVSANISTDAIFNCDRCLVEVKRGLSVNVEETFVKLFEDIADDGERYTYDGDKILIDDMIKEKFLLAFPEYVVCKSDCKGLCPICGCDLNMNQCNCQDKEKDEESGNPFAALRDITSGGKNGGTKKKDI